jgi:YVTN family beta-propeller protein
MADRTRLKSTRRNDNLPLTCMSPTEERREHPRLNASGRLSATGAMAFAGCMGLILLVSGCLICTPVPASATQLAASHNNATSEAKASALGSSDVSPMRAQDGGCSPVVQSYESEGSETLSLSPGAQEYFFVGSTAGRPLPSVSWVPDVVGPTYPYPPEWTNGTAVSIGHQTNDTGSFSGSFSNYGIAGIGISDFSNYSVVGGYSNGSISNGTVQSGTRLLLDFSVPIRTYVVLLVGAAGTGSMNMTGASLSKLVDVTYNEGGAETNASVAIYAGNLTAGAYDVNISGTVDSATNSGTVMTAGAYAFCTSISKVPAGPSCSTSSISVGTGPQGIAFDPASLELFVGNSLSNDVSVISALTCTVVASIPAGDDPGGGVAYDPSNGLVYVDNWDSSNVTVINGTTNQAIGSISTTVNPDGLAYDAGTKEIYVAQFAGGSLTVLNGSLNQVMGTIEVGGGPRGVAYDPDNGDIYVTQQNSNEVAAVNPSNGSVLAEIPVGSVPVAVVFDAFNGNLYVTNIESDNVSVISGTSNLVIGSIRVGSSPDEGEAFNVFNGNIFVGNSGSSNVSIISGATDRLIGSVPVGVAPRGIAVDTFTGLVFVTNDESNNVTILKNGLSNVTSHPMSLFVSASTVVGFEPLSVDFSANITGGLAPYSCQWYFGDGSTASGTAVSHAFRSANTFVVIAEARDVSGDVATSSLTVLALNSTVTNTSGAIAVSISASPASGPPPLNTTLTASASGGTGPYTITWNFGDGSPVTSGSQVKHSYTVPGIYAATLLLIDAKGLSSTTGVFINVAGSSETNSIPRVIVTALALRGQAPLTLAFTPLVIGGTSPYTLNWSFGDGTPSLRENSLLPITHTFAAPGTYAPEVRISDSRGNSSIWNASTSPLPTFVTALPVSHSTSPLPISLLVLVGALLVVGSIAGVLTVIVVRRRKPPALKASAAAGRADGQGPADGNGRWPGDPIGRKNPVEEPDPMGDMLVPCGRNPVHHSA